VCAVLGSLTIDPQSIQVACMGLEPRVQRDGP
jgi:hypothetical protein